MTFRPGFSQVLCYIFALFACHSISVLATSPDVNSELGTITGYLKLPDGTPLNTTLITLNDGSHSTYTSSPTASFTFHNIPPGIHLLDVHSHQYAFSQIKIQLLPTSMSTPSCIEYAYPGAPKTPADHPLYLTAHATLEYFEQQPPFSPFKMLRNPMVLMMVFSIGMMVIMPSMMSNMDPEQKEQMKKQMEMQSDPSKMLSQLWGDLKGEGGAEEEKKKIKKDRIVKRVKRE
mmetsp:Transcript_2488/g.2701  ORF Transcript_2488/g.2701 Transcript_2488/m.2701 type:complete len:232 (-) Transcript_2488:143-838(-)|eukprot:CAMPEP_0198254114 /NCGR_PEP_ID=MMETSP1447-20131203/4492_1 /TAXON_ID=420782 /ORGANISM="Chaetoceros dichaeta, Strain CCMP1751" /LENGTH=231 /DNA_ID=CAMNT_0043940065 /DNA_START=57 /DNA_END=752 /DNA_ORIENTATION=-